MSLALENKLILFSYKLKEYLLFYP